MMKKTEKITGIVLAVILLVCGCFFGCSIETSATGTMYYGDVDRNGQVAVSDALLVLKHVVGAQVITDSLALQLADMNHDGEQDVSDALLILKTVVGIAKREPYRSGGQGKTLVVYFSCTGTTETLAKYAADILGGDLYEIVPEDPYTEEDLAYYTGGRADREQNDPSARPAISGQVDNMEQYDTILLGYPIWHSQAPRIISTFLESYDLAGKTIIPFCTSHSSGIGSSADNLHHLAPGANWREGRRFGSGVSRQEVESWIAGLDLNKMPDVSVFDLAAGENGKAPVVTLNSGYEMPIVGLGTYSLLDDVCVDSVAAALQRGFRMIDTAYMYGNEKEVGEGIRKSGVPREDVFVITKLYPNQYGDAVEAIDMALEKLGVDYIDMMLLHHPGDNDVAAYKAMEQAVADGKIRSLGLSNWYIEEMEAFLPQVDIPPALVQNEIHPYYQESEVIDYMHQKGIVMQAWYPLGGRGHQSELLSDPVIEKIAQAHGKSAAQVILRWDLQNGVVVIPGSSNPDHMTENISLFDFSLTEEEMAEMGRLNRNEKHDWY